MKGGICRFKFMRFEGEHAANIHGDISRTNDDCGLGV